MRLFATIYKKPVTIIYRQSICSLTTLFILILTVISVIAPFYVLSFTSQSQWYNPKPIINYHQPRINYHYEYIFMIGETDELGGFQSKIICSSYSYLNELIESIEGCTQIKFLENDFNRDGKNDQMIFEFSYDPATNQSIENPKSKDFQLSLSLKFHSDVTLPNCNLNIPTQLLLTEEYFTYPLYENELIINGNLLLQQQTSFYCPNFLQNIKTQFNHKYIPSVEYKENVSDNLQNYDFNLIRNKFLQNPGVIQFKTISKQWKLTTTDQIKIKIIIEIGESMIRFNPSIWQCIGHIWIEYLSIFLLLAWIINRFKEYLMERFWLKAWQFVPWKKID